MIRRPLDLLLASQRPGIIARKLSALGGSVTQVHFDAAIATMTYGLRVADAIIIDSSADNPLRSDRIVRAANLALAIHGLPNYVAMPNGARWNGIPIAFLVDDEQMAAAVAGDPALHYVLPCITRPLINWYYDYVDPWLEIYQRIDCAAYINSQERLQEMESIGHRFQTENGRWIRLVAPLLQRRRGSLPELETRLYDGRSDRFLTRARVKSEPWNGRDVLLLERVAVERDLYNYEYLVSHARAEVEMQRFYEQRPYLLGAGAFDTIAHPAFHPLGSSKPMYPDLVQRSFNVGLVPKAAKIIELKTPRARLLTRTGLDYHWSRNAVAGLAQTRRYAEHAMSPQYDRQMVEVLGEAPKRVKKLLVAGCAYKYDPERLDRARRYDADVDVRGYDEMFEVARDRFVT